jgi:RNA 2',3'-cyclic 3'-phosphodiesterase
MSVIRAFIAIDLSPELHECLRKVSMQLKPRLADAPVRWVPIENIHLTLKFLGDVSEKNLEILKKIMSKVISGTRPFVISVGGLGAFPKIQNPRVIWIGLEGPPELFSLQKSLELETARLGYSREERSFSPHLTLGRVSRSASSRDIRLIADALMDFKIGFLGVARIDSVCLYRSELRPGGAAYTRLFAAETGE